MAPDQPDRKREDLDLLQALLVEPELKKLRRQVAELTQKVATLEDKVARLEGVQQQLAEVTDDWVDQKLIALRQEMLAMLPQLIDQAIETQIEPGQTFSIRVMGLEQGE